jgi:hypothetical protein
MIDLQITVTTDDPKNIAMMYRLKAAFDAAPLSEKHDWLIVQFACEDESKAPVMQFKINDSEEVQSTTIREFQIKFPTTFFPTSKSIACMIGKEVVRIGGRDAQKIRRDVAARFEKQGLSVPPEIYKEALSEAIIFDQPTGSIVIRGEYKTRHLADVLGIEPQSVRYHLRNLLSEGVDIGSGRLWETAEEFERICNLIKPRLGAHGRRS